MTALFFDGRACETRRNEAGERMNKADFIKVLGVYRKALPRHQLLTLRGQALSGDVVGACRGFKKLLRQEGMENMAKCPQPEFRRES